MRSRVIRKTVTYLALVIAVVVFNFLLPRMMPGSPVRDDGAALTAAERARIYESFNLDRPLPEQFFLYLRSLITGDFGMSFSRRAPIADILAAALPWTVLLSLSSTAVSLILGAFLGSISVRLRRRGRDFPIIIGVALLGSFPVFWVGMVLLAIFGVQLGALPMFGAYSLWAGYTGSRHILDVLRHLVMPMTTMALGSLMIFFTASRTGLMAVLNEDYIRFAQVRGLSRRRVRFFYEWRNSALPVATVLILHLGFIFSGSVVIEAVFSYPGIGTVLLDAVLARDYPLMQYSFLLIAITVVLMSLVSDLLQPLLDPRVRKL